MTEYRVFYTLVRKDGSRNECEHVVNAASTAEAKEAVIFMCHQQGLEPRNIQAIDNT